MPLTDENAGKDVINCPYCKKQFRVSERDALTQHLLAPWICLGIQVVAWVIMLIVDSVYTLGFVCLMAPVCVLGVFSALIAVVQAGRKGTAAAVGVSLLGLFLNGAIPLLGLLLAVLKMISGLPKT